MRMYLYNYIFILTLLEVGARASDILGRLTVPPGSKEGFSDVEVLLDGGTNKGFIKADGTFSIHNIPSGSYTLEILSTAYMYEPVRIDISSKGTVRARKLNNLKPTQVQLMRYPLELKPIMYMKYFQQREKFSIFDMLKNPMVLMMVLPLVMLLVLPKLINTNDPELKKEMEQSMGMFNPGQSQLPDLSEWLSSLGGGGAKKTTKQKDVSKKVKRK